MSPSKDDGTNVNEVVFDVRGSEVEAALNDDDILHQ
jgi:hypothetical protein